MKELCEDSEMIMMYLGVDDMINLVKFMSLETPTRNKCLPLAANTLETNNNFIKYFLPIPDIANKSLIQKAKESNLIGKVLSNDCTFNFQKSSLQSNHRTPYSIKRSDPSTLQCLLDSAIKEKQQKSSSTVKNLMLTDFHKGASPPQKASLCSPQGKCLIPSFNAKMSISTKDEDSIPKIKSLILTPRAPINDFSNVYSKNLKKTNIAASSNEEIVFPSYLMNTPIDNALQKENDEDKEGDNEHRMKMITSSMKNCNKMVLRRKRRRDNMPTSIKSKMIRSELSNRSIRQHNNQSSASSFKPKKIKKTSKCFIDFDKAPYTPMNDPRYNYLNLPFTNTFELNTSYNHEPSFIAYQLYLTFGKSNEENLRFGENPLSYYQNLLENLKSKDLTESNKSKIYQKLDGIHKQILKLPVFTLPNEPMNDRGKIQCRQAKNEKLSSNSNQEKYRCLICDFAFGTAQGLGGHMSRKHKDQSKNYKKKKAIREKRAPVRMMNDLAKKLLCQKYGHDYDAWNKTKTSKKALKDFIDNHRKEYMTCRKELKEMKGL